MRVLMLTHRLPYAPNRGDRLRAYYVLRALAAQADVDLVSLVHSREEASRACDLIGAAASVETVMAPRSWNRMVALARLAGDRPLTHALLSGRGMRQALDRVVRDRRPDVVLAYCSGMARFALEPPLDGRPLVVDMVDVDSEKWRALAPSSAWPLRWVYAREARSLARFEAAVARRADATLVVNERERDALAALAPGASIEVVPNGVDVRSFDPPCPSSLAPRVIFCGVMGYRPNEEAALFLGRDVWPLVRAKRPDAQLVLVGASPTARVRALRSRLAGVEVTGGVDDVRPYLWSASVAVAPLLTARGVQNKVLEAVAAGLPCVMTPVVQQGLPASLDPACRVADDAASFAAAILDLLRASPAERRAMAHSADVSSLAWPVRLAPLLQILRQAGSGVRQHAA